MPSVNNVGTPSQAPAAGNTIASNGGNAQDLSNMFLELLVAQVSHQNPLDPMDGTQYVSQLAEFSSVQSLQSLRTDSERSLNMQHSQQVLQASALIGQQVSIESSSLNLSEGATVSGHAELQGPASEVSVSLYDGEGRLISRKNVDVTNSRTVNFDFGDQDAGSYRVEVHALNNGRLQPATTYINGEVTKVSVGDSVEHISLLVSGLGNHSLLDVEQFSSGRG